MAFNNTVVLVGQPNVGKSVVMNLLTGVGAAVSNYPGTTVEITEGTYVSGKNRIRVIDTPGTYSLHSDTEEQKVTHRVLMDKEVNLVVNIIDGRNLERNLYLTLQLLELEFPLIVVINQMDMVEELGIELDIPRLSSILGVPVVPMIASRKMGLERLTELLDQKIQPPQSHIKFSPGLEENIEMLRKTIEQTVSLSEGPNKTHSSRALASHLMEHDSLDEVIFQKYPQLSRMVEELQEKAAAGFVCTNCFRGCSFCPAAGVSNPPLMTCLERTEKAKAIFNEVVVRRPGQKAGLRMKIEQFVDRPFTGIPTLLGVSYLAYLLVAKFMEMAEEFIEWVYSPLETWMLGLAGTFTEGSIMAVILEALAEGLLVPFSVVMPAMLSIYVVMAILEDSGFLPRIAVVMDRAMSFLGLPGQSIIPLVIGFGCKAPAILATRTLPGKQSRYVVSALLGIVIPCVTSLAIITGAGQNFGAKLAVVYGSMFLVFVIIGWVLGRKSSDESSLTLEVPPLRLPVLSNVMRKLWMRVSGFFSHVLPILAVTSVIVRIMIDAGLFIKLALLNPVSFKFFGVRGEVLAAVAVTAVQRYMAPMVLLNLALSAREATIAVAMVSLSLPCLPVAILIRKEIGGWALVRIVFIALAISLGTGIVLNLFLP